MDQVLGSQGRGLHYRVPEFGDAVAGDGAHGGTQASELNPERRAEPTLPFSATEQSDVVAPEVGPVGCSRCRCGASMGGGVHQEHTARASRFVKYR
jgi:hypothetical protein